MSGHNADVSVTINFHQVKLALEYISERLKPEYISLDDVARIRKSAETLEERKRLYLLEQSRPQSLVE